QELDRRVIDLQLECVHLLIPPDHLLRLLPVPLQQGFHRQPDHLLRHPRHPDQRRLQSIQLILEMALRRHPNLPVMYASVRSSRGVVKSCCVGPYSTNSPMYRKPVKSETRAACCMLCVTTMTV